MRCGASGARREAKLTRHCEGPRSDLHRLKRRALLQRADPLEAARGRSVALQELRKPTFGEVKWLLGLRPRGPRRKDAAPQQLDAAAVRLRFGFETQISFL